ncbi:CynX/NimT family MFS transporter [Streptomyces tendae]|uniref:CynX/NimT family MFS transporter n=1 Tax=Streptomyces tendae TaxID=1932 RepID=UPI0037FC13F8
MRSEEDQVSGPADRIGVDASSPLPGHRDTALSPKWRDRLLVAGLVLTACNLRPAVTSLGPLLEEVRQGLHMSAAVAGVLTSVPALCFSVFGVAAPRLARRLGPASVVALGMAAVALGLIVRPWIGSAAGFLTASALALVGIALSNVLMPVIVKRYFPNRVGAMTGLYSMALSLGTAVAAGVSVPVTSALGGDWRLGLAVWGALAVAAVLPWLPFLRKSGPATISDPHQPAGAGTADHAVPRVSRSRTAWALAVFMGLQSAGAYITMGWLPQIYRDAGLPAGTAGLLLAVTMAVGVPLAFVIPRMAARRPHQSPVVLILGVAGLIGYAGLYFAPVGGAWAWALILGVANCTFPLALTMVSLRARTSTGVAQLSAFAQSVGYLLAIPGPILIGTLYEHSGGWGLPIAVMSALLLPQMAAGYLAGRDRVVEDELAPR